jgi:alkylation response protein AidB-like acyl-CoA dehydrogenase
MNDELAGIIETAKSFAERDQRPRWESLDTPSEEVLGGLLRVLARIGFYSMQISEDAGGAGQGAAACAVFIEEVSRVCPALGAVMASHAMGMAAALSCADGDARKKLLSDIVSREGRGEAPVAALCWMEDAARAGGGLGLDEMETTLAEDGGDFLLNGRKLYVPGAAAAAFLVVVAKTQQGGSAYVVVPTDTAGVELSGAVDMMGLRLCPFNHVALNGVKVTVESVLALNVERRELLKVFARFDACIGAVGVGMAREAYGKASLYAVGRYQGGKMISGHDAIRGMLAEMALGIESARALMLGAAANADSGRAAPADMLCSTVCAETAVRAALDGIQILGGYGYMRDYGMERILRDAKTFQTAVVLPQCRKTEFINNELVGIGGYDYMRDHGTERIPHDAKTFQISGE